MKNTEITDRIHELYERLLRSPRSFASRGSIEQVVFGMETILNALVIPTDRSESYNHFLTERKFGMFPFDAKFETRHHCIISFVDKEQYKADSQYSELQEAYLSEFREHWADFMEWRKKILYPEPDNHNDNSSSKEEL